VPGNVLGTVEFQGIARYGAIHDAPENIRQVADGEITAALAGNVAQKEEQGDAGDVVRTDAFHVDDDECARMRADPADSLAQRLGLQQAEVTPDQDFDPVVIVLHIRPQVRPFRQERAGTYGI